MNLQVREESRTERLARLLEAWRYDRSRLMPDDIEWLLERAQEAMEAGVGVCQQCARDLDAGQRALERVGRDEDGPATRRTHRKSL